MSRIRFASLLLLIILLPGLAGCQMPSLGAGPAPSNPSSGGEAAAAAAPTVAPQAPQTLITFRALAPANTPEGGLLYLTLVDEVTGLALNVDPYPMEPLPHDDPAKPFGYFLTLPFPLGTRLTYRYERDLGGVRVSEHLSDGTQTRYRTFVVNNQAVVEDVISRWTDTAFTGLTGRIQGKVTGADGSAIPNAFVTAGGMQTFSAGDGAFLLEGLPEGTHHLVVFSVDGSFQTFQQGARVAALSTTPVDVQVQPAKMVNVVFVVTPPAGTPPIVPLRMAGSLFGLGNSFGNLRGGLSGVVGRMPVLKPLPDGRYTITLSLPEGVEIKYKYTLGDGFWNAEHTSDGKFVVRSLIPSAQTALVEDKIATWSAGGGPLTFDLSVQAELPPGEFVSIQFNPLIGWTEPLPMWHLGGGRWAYILYSPLNLPGNFSYRYCRSNQCGVADDDQTPGMYGAGRDIKISGEAQVLSGQVGGWIEWKPLPVETLPEISAAGRGTNFAAGVALSDLFHPSFTSLMTGTMQNIAQMNANWVILTPTWAFGRAAPGNNPPDLAPIAGQDPLWPELWAEVRAAQASGLHVALYPTARFAVPMDQWWATAPRQDPGWWPVWFEQYRQLVMNNAELAAETQAGGLILGGDWLQPALSGGTLFDGQPSGVPEDAEQRWRNLIAEVRSRYSGQILWAMSDAQIAAPPAFIDAVDQIYLTLRLNEGQTFEQHLELPLATWLDGVAWPTQLATQKPLILALALPSGKDLAAQSALYQEALQAAAERDWISGIISTGYYPAVQLQDAGPNINGKPVQALLSGWFAALRK